MPGADGTVAILTALAEESRPLRRRMSAARPVAGPGLSLWEGELAARRVLLAETGAGARAAAAAAADLFARFGPARWIGAGFAGAISPGLPFGSVVVAAELADGPAGGEAVLDAGMARRALACDSGARAVRAVSTAGIVASRAEKNRLLSAAGGSLPVTVDMESAAWARAGSGIPGLIVRVVTDSAEDEIADFVAASVAPDGGIDRGRLVRHAILHPSAIGKLLALRRRARLCGERLADFVERFAARGF
jgi:adenosylhomocysteine nucleosidase